MSFRTFRHTLAGTVLTAALCLIGPSPAQAADPQEPVHESPVWEAAWQWIQGWAATLAPTSTATPEADAGYRDSKDAGWTIDPDG
jgi:hypothetical protein